MRLPIVAALFVVAIVLLTASLVLGGRTSDRPPTELAVRTAAEGTERLSAEDASGEFDNLLSTSRRLRAGHLSHGSHWLRILLPTDAIDTRKYVKIESLRLKTGEFWLLERRNIDHPWSIVSSMEWSSTRDGIAISIPSHHTVGEVAMLGRITSESFNRPRATLVDGLALSDGQFQFERNGGFLLGSMLMLSMFSLLVALFNRDAVFFLFGGWLLTGLRVAAQNGGWDAAWLGLTLDTETQRSVLRVSLLAYFVLSLGLFEALFPVELSRLRLRKQLRFVTIGVVIAAVGAWIIAPMTALIVAWICGFISIAFISISVVRILRINPTPTAYAYAAAWWIGAAGLVGEIAFSSGMSVAWPSILNSQASALASALMMAIALASRVRAERAARISAQTNAATALQRFRETYNTMPVGLFSMKLDGTIIEFNPAFGAMFGVTRAARPQAPRNWAELSSPQAFEFLIGQAISGRITDTEIAIASRDGGRRWLHMRALRKGGRIETWIEDVTARKEAEGRLQFLADHDSLTGLLNRRGFNAHLERALTAAKTQVVCFAYIDLDRFKLVNDLFGHVAGDQILRQMATRTREVVHAPHVAARVGGDEFVVIIHGLELAAAHELCEVLRKTLSERPYHHQDKAFSVAASLGLIQLDPHMTPRDALTASDRACAEAKRSGGSVVVALDSTSAQLTSYLDEIKLVADMRERLPVENFFTQLQPIVSLRNPYSSLCYEVLVRMRDPSGAVVPPARFIAAAERNGLMSQIDRWVLRSTLEWLDANPEHRDALGFCTVNLSGASLNDEKFLQDTMALIRNHSEATARVCFEITESVALYDLNTTRRFVDKVKSFGARVALDDFGAGYTSFNYLKELPGDLVKIDGSFIRDINMNSANFAITRAVVDLAHEIGMACVAEWAENAAIVRSLIDLNVDYAQGFGLCRPVDRELLLNTNHGVSLVQDDKVVEILREQRVPLLQRGDGGATRRSILTV